MRATVSHFEIPARDPERVARFYREVFGWTIEPLAWDGPAYFRVKAALPLATAGNAGNAGNAAGAGSAREGIDGGLTGGGSYAGDQPLLMIHIAGATLEECLERIIDAGGTVDLPATPVGPEGALGRFARFLDPEGHRLGLWEAAVSGAKT
jgi:predicted enzyme related to lactoylglutathione lyase